MIIISKTQPYFDFKMIAQYHMKFRSAEVKWLSGPDIKTKLVYSSNSLNSIILALEDLAIHLSWNFFGYR